MTVVKIDDDLISELKKRFPELGKESDGVLVRVALRKLLREVEINAD